LTIKNALYIDIGSSIAPIVIQGCATFIRGFWKDKDVFYPL